MRPAEALVAAALAAAGGAQAGDAALKYRNVTAGGELRPGVYGRIEPGGALPPPLIYQQPIIAAQTLVPPGTRPVYLYVPPGQVRKWDLNCQKWQACDVPVLFVRVDDSPSRLGSWRRLKEHYALQRE